MPGYIFKCLVPTCSNKTSQVDKIFIKVPQNLDIQKRWWAAAKVKNTNYHRAFICEDHFDVEKDAENWMQFKIIGKNLKIKGDVVPHKYIDRPPKIPIKSSLSDSAKKRRIETLKCIEKKEECLASTSFEHNVSSPKRPKTSSKIVARKLFKTDSESPDEKRMKVSSHLESPSGSFQIHYLGKTENTSKSVQAKITPIMRSVSTETKYKDLKKSNIVAEKSCSPILTLQKLTESKLKASLKKTKFPSDVSSSSRDSATLSTSSWSQTNTTSTEENKETLHKPSSRKDSTLYLIKQHSKFYLGIPDDLYKMVDFISKKAQIPSDHVILTLWKIRLDDPYIRIGRDFDLSRSSIHNIFVDSVPKIATVLQHLIFWPEKDIIKKYLPLPFRARYNEIQSIIDCFEIEIQKPSNPLKQSSTWSEYKHCNTIKFLISCTPNGFINFISEGFGGRISDTDIISKSIYLEVLPKCHVMADRGFKHVASLLEAKACLLIRPPSVSTGQKLTVDEVKQNKRIASLRIHIERVIRRVREFLILKPHACINNNLLQFINDITVIVCALINLQTPLI